MPVHTPSLDHPYHDLSGGQWLRGNLHTHTVATDGEQTLQEVIDDYAGRGYDFLMISDHDILTGDEEYDTHNPKGMVLIPGNEISSRGCHMLHVNADRLVEGHADRQRTINEVNDSQGFIIVNHPNWGKNFNHCSIDQLVEWDSYAGIEIYNGVIEFLEGSPYAMNKWDMLLTLGHRAWGFANDDSHYKEGNVAQGWNVAYVADRRADSIAAALQQGRFYASTGMKITKIQTDGRQIHIEADYAEEIRAICDNGQQFQVADGPSIETQVPDDATYVRFECLGHGDRFAWTQPFFVVTD